jgi:hypothetical protein
VDNALLHDHDAVFPLRLFGGLTPATFISLLLGGISLRLSLLKMMAAKVGILRGWSRGMRRRGESVGAEDRTCAGNAFSVTTSAEVSSRRTRGDGGRRQPAQLETISSVMPVLTAFRSSTAIVRKATLSGSSQPA